MTSSYVLSALHAVTHGSAMHKRSNFFTACLCSLKLARSMAQSGFCFGEVGIVHVTHEDSNRISVALSAEDEHSMRVAGSRA